MLAKPIAFRPHHFLCSLSYKGLGYSPSFVANYNEIVAQIRHDESTQLQVVQGLDSICGSCPHQRTTANKCTSEKTIKRLDDAHLKVLNLVPGEILTWKHAKNRIKNNMDLEAFHSACKPCEWKKLGICEAALVALKNGK